MQRGGCPVFDKLSVLDKSGALAVIIINDASEKLGFPGGDREEGDVPVIMVDRETTGVALMTALRSRGVRVLVFDFDKTLVSIHTVTPASKLQGRSGWPYRCCLSPPE